MARQIGFTEFAVDIAKFNIPRYLATQPMFSNMQLEELQRVARGCVLERIERGKVLFRTGEMCQAFHIVVLGQIKLYLISPAGVEKVIELCGPGHSFAEAIMFMGVPHLVNAQTLTETLLLTVEKNAVLREIEADSRFALRMLAGISRRLHGLIKDVEGYALHSGVQRVISYLLGGLMDGGGSAVPQSITVSLPVSKSTIASRLSLTPEYFSRVLHELEAAKLITVERRDIHIHDTAKLAGYQPGK